ncbi:MAG: HAMP domain-containing histidine kinase [Bdellovibrionaceae bacterium]|nr:HAMP domain-containing histidine kinase [Bdellovibrio sp.]
MLSKFLETHRAEVLTLAEEKTLKLAGSLPSSVELRKGLPVFYNHLINYLSSASSDSNETKIIVGAAEHGKELLRLNYTLSHVVHGYGALCQAVTEFAQMKEENITSHEFNELNMCLDVAIAAAVSEFQFRSVQASEKREVQHLGFLVHELRNALSSATIAHEMMKQGLVGTGGSTSRVLGQNLSIMRDLIDRSLSEVRMRADPEVHIEKFSLNFLVDQIILTAQSEAKNKNQLLSNEIKLPIELESDRQLVLSTIANLVQNAIKYTKNGGRILVRAGIASDNVIIEIEDECGGIQPDVLKNLFKPFNSGGFDQTGLGLGLTIVQRAVQILQGEISINNLPSRGCAFRIELPKKLIPKPLNRARTAEKSAQPSMEKKDNS